MFYILSWAGKKPAKVAKFRSVADAKLYVNDLPEGPVVQVSEASHLLRELTAEQFLDLYNRTRPEAVAHLGNRRSAAARLFAALDTISRGEDPMAKETKKSAAAAGPAAAEGPSVADIRAKREAVMKDLTAAKLDYQNFVKVKKAELNGLRLGRSRGKDGKPSEVMTKAIQLLSRKDGATKDQLIEETGMAGGYASALLTRILKEKGYEVVASAIEGSRAKAYRITKQPKAA